MNTISLVEFYRVKNWIKITGLSILGLTSSVITTNISILFMGVLQSIFLLSFLFAYHDYNDYLVENKNYPIGKLIRKSISNKKTVLVLVLLPLVLSLLPLVLNFSVGYGIFYLIFVILSIGYSSPKIRLGDIPVVDTLVVISLYSLIFIQSFFFTNTMINEKFYFLLLWSISFYFLTEFLHQLSHYKNDVNSTVKFLGNKKAISILKYSLFIPIFGSIAFYLLFPELKYYCIIMLLSGSIRYIYLMKKIEKTNFEELRHKMGGFIEGMIYLFLNIFNL